MKKKIIHITLTTGHRRNSFVDDINPQLYFQMRAIFQNAAQSDGISFIDNTWLKLTKIDDDSYVCTLHIKTDMGLCPILTTAGSKVMNPDLWEALHNNGFTPVVTKKNKPPVPPYIADKIEVPHPSAINIFQWTGDFSRCLGWMMLFPQDIAKRTMIDQHGKN